MHVKLAVAAALACTTSMVLPAQDDLPGFFDVAGSVGVTLMNISGGAAKDYIVEAMGNGAAFFDYDNDGDMDLLIVNGSTLENHATGGDPMMTLYRNDGGFFVDVTGEAGLRKNGWGMGICAADYDNDGNVDFYITAYGPNLLYRNNGNSTFTEVTPEAGTGDERWSTNCAFGDYDRDGHVDLYVANYVESDQAVGRRRGETADCRYMGVDVFCGPLGLAAAGDVLYRNNGDGSFTDVTRSAGVEAPAHYGLGIVFSDFDNDGWPDIYVANDAVPNFLFRNNRDGTFSEIGLISGTALSEAGDVQSGMGLAVGDYTGNRLFDIFVTHFSRDTNTLYRNIGDMLFIDDTTAAGLGEVALQYLGWGAGFADLNNDGWLDIFVANGHVYPEVDDLNVRQSYLQRKEVYRNRGDGRFEEVAPRLKGDLLERRSARGTAFGDFDNDGDIDVLAVNINDHPSLYRNDGGNRSHWITFRLEGVQSNRSAIGARVDIDVGPRTQVREVRSGGSYLSHNDMRLHFGVGRVSRIDRVEIRWPNGRTRELRDLEVNRFVTVREGQGIVSVVSPER